MTYKYDKSMPYEIPLIPLRKLRDQKALSVSAHAVIKGKLEDESIIEQLSLPQRHILTVYAKEGDLHQSQEEAAFSALYRVDIGAKAARTVFLEGNEVGETVGVASIELKQFVEYRELFTKKHRALQERLIRFDRRRRPIELTYVHGLADVLMSAWLYGEDDLHRGNIGLSYDTEGTLQWSRIDFGMSFANITHDSRLFRAEVNRYNAISLGRLQSFPVLGEYAPFYWPTSITAQNNLFNVRGRRKGNAYFDSDKRLFKGLQTGKNTEATSQFANEKNAFLFKLFLSSIEDKKALLLNTITDEAKAKRLANSIQSRTLTMQWTALCDESFQTYVKSMPDAIRDRLINEVNTSSQEAYGKGDETKKMQERSKDLLDRINNIQRKEERCKLTTTLEEDIQAVDKLSLVINTLALQPVSDEAELVEYQKQLYQMQSQILNRYLQEGKPEEGLRQLSFIIFKQNAMQPLTEMVSSFSQSPRIYDYLVKFRERVFQSVSTLKGLSSDELYQHDVCSELRNVQSVLTSLLRTGIEDERLLRLLPRLDDSCHINSVKKDVLKLEVSLLELTYEKTYDSLNNRLGKMSAIDDMNVFSLCADHIMSIQKSYLSTYLSHCLDNSMTVSMIEKSPMLVSLSQVQRLFNDILTPDLIDSANGERQLMVRDFKRIQHIIRKYELNTPAVTDIEKKQRVESMTKAILEMELVLSRLALDLQRKQAEKILIDATQEFNLQGYSNALAFVDGDGFDAKATHYKAMIGANEQLSMALARPEYHDTLALQDVSHSGYLGAMALKYPNLGTAKACTDHAKFLANSHQTRRKTAVAIALAFVSLVIVTAAVTALCWPAGIGIAVGIAAWCAVGVGGVTTLGTTQYAGRRFFRDKDKAKRKLDDVAEKTVMAYA